MLSAVLPSSGEFVESPADQPFADVDVSEAVDCGTVRSVERTGLQRRPIGLAVLCEVGPAGTRAVRFPFRADVCLEVVVRSQHHDA